MKKGVQYSHYCGTELQDLMSSIKLSIRLLDINKNEATEWLNHSKKVVEELRNKIAELDKINKMNY